MDRLQLLAAIIGLGANAPLIYRILKGTVQQNFAAFFLWALLDIIAATTTIIQKGNYALPLAYACSASIVTTCLAFKKQVSWTWVESVTTFLVLVCLFVWYAIGPEAGTVASSLAVVIASVPQGVDTWKKPESTPTGIYTLFLIANAMSLYAGKDWTIEERLYAGCTTFLCAVLILFSLRKPAYRTVPRAQF